jgi:hypothetical protein
MDTGIVVRKLMLYKKQLLSVKRFTIAGTVQM